MESLCSESFLTVEHCETSTRAENWDARSQEHGFGEDPAEQLTTSDHQTAAAAPSPAPDEPTWRGAKKHRAAMEALVVELAAEMSAEIASGVTRAWMADSAWKKRTWPAELTTPELWAEKKHAPPSLYIVFANARASTGPAGNLPRLQLPSTIHFYVRVKWQRAGFPFPPGVSKRFLQKARVLPGLESAGPVARLAFDERHVIGLMKHQHLSHLQLVLEVPSTASVNPGLVSRGKGSNSPSSAAGLPRSLLGPPRPWNRPMPCPRPCPRPYP